MSLTSASIKALFEKTIQHLACVQSPKSLFSTNPSIREIFLIRFMAFNRLEQCVALYKVARVSKNQLMKLCSIGVSLLESPKHKRNTSPRLKKSTTGKTCRYWHMRAVSLSYKNIQMAPSRR